MAYIHEHGIHSSNGLHYNQGWPVQRMTTSENYRARQKKLGSHDCADTQLNGTTFVAVTLKLMEWDNFVVHHLIIQDFVNV